MDINKENSQVYVLPAINYQTKNRTQQKVQSL